jgi:hypothetical protein
MEAKKTGVELIAEERQRQIDKEGWTAQHDAEHKYGELAIAAACYAVYNTDANVNNPNTRSPNGWPWNDNSFKPADLIKNLVRAGALIAAEIDNIQKQQP